MKPLVLVGLALAAVVASVATATAHRPRHHPTTLAIDAVVVKPNGAILVSGQVRSDARDCDLFRGVGLVRVRPGRDKLLDIGVSSLAGREWAVRSKPGAADGSRIAVVAPKFRSVSVTVRVGPHGHHGRPHRKVLVCDAARAPVDYIE